MHASSMENMKKCFLRYVSGRLQNEQKQPFRVLDIGGADVNGTYADLFSGPGFKYTAADIQPGPGVKMVLDDPYILPADDESFDFVLSGQMLEHCEFFWRSFAEMVRVVKPNGLIFLIAPSSGPIHNYPVDCYRFYPDSYRALASYSGCHLVDLWHDNRGPWNDLVGVFSKSPIPKYETVFQPAPIVEEDNHFLREYSTPEFDKVQGEVPYLKILDRIHSELSPKTYLEIGIRRGRSLALAACPAVGVDPYPDIAVPLSENTDVVCHTSDDFFELGRHPILKQGLDFVFIDGMHLFEYVLRDFMNVEKLSGPNTTVVIDDIFPNLKEQATRTRETRVWTGDVWKIYDCLKKYRPDLQLIPVDTEPTGLLIVSGLNSKDRTLWNRYNPIVREYTTNHVPPPSEVLGRADAVSPKSESFTRILQTYKTAKQERRSFQACASDIQRILLDDAPSCVRLSVIVIAYNMARELPRTLLSLSANMQKGVSIDDYEIIVVDNSSTQPFDVDACKSISPNIRIVRHDSEGSASPVGAINRGLELARGELVGVFIDGARMASPGLLSSALEVAELSPNAVIGSIAFHLGHEVQMESVKRGYAQDVEDKLLASVPWENDGYRLFEISVFAGSSGNGWFALPSETNALFMKRKKWTELGGYDQRFQTPGGGLANLDMWKRACGSHNADVYLLAGEATFHQFHGGVATNAVSPPKTRFHEEYELLRGERYTSPKVAFKIFGSFQSVHKKSLQLSN